MGEVLLGTRPWLLQVREDAAGAELQGALNHGNAWKLLLLLLTALLCCPCI